MTKRARVYANGGESDRHGGQHKMMVKLLWLKHVPSKNGAIGTRLVFYTRVANRSWQGNKLQPQLLQRSDKGGQGF